MVDPNATPGWPVAVSRAERRLGAVLGSGVLMAARRFCPRSLAVILWLPAAEMLTR